MNFEGITLAASYPWFSGLLSKPCFQASETHKLMFDTKIREVNSLDQEVTEYGETPKKLGQIHDIWRWDSIAQLRLALSNLQTLQMKEVAPFFDSFFLVLKIRFWCKSEDFNY